MKSTKTKVRRGNPDSLRRIANALTAMADAIEHGRCDCKDVKIEGGLYCRYEPITDGDNRVVRVELETSGKLYVAVTEPRTLH